MDLHPTASDRAFQREVEDWLEHALGGEFAAVRGRGGPGDEHALIEERRRWEQHMAAAGWSCLGWDPAHGGRGCTLWEQVLFEEAYARARGPGRLGHIGETLLGPTVAALGTDAQRARFLPPIREACELWCQGYSEPNAGSDLANVQCRAELDGDHWVITGQKIWTSHAQVADWCFALCRTDPDVPRHKGISYLLVPMRQAGVDIRPIRQITGTSEFCEVFVDGARAAAEHVVGPVNGGWRVAMATLAFERGASTLAQQIGFRQELDAVVQAARESGAIDDSSIRRRLAQAEMELRIMRWNALRTLTGLEGTELPRAASITKLFWATWHRDLGELAVDVLGADAEVRPEGPGYPLTPLQRLFLWTRCDTIYAGSNEIQRNIIGERALGLPRGPRVRS